jgi:hypothetical protein
MPMMNNMQGGGQMRSKIASIQWRRLLYSGAAFATLLMAAGAKFKNN